MAPNAGISAQRNSETPEELSNRIFNQPKPAPRGGEGLIGAPIPSWTQDVPAMLVSPWLSVAASVQPGLSTRWASGIPCVPWRRNNGSCWWRFRWLVPHLWVLGYPTRQARREGGKKRTGEIHPSHAIPPCAPSLAKVAQPAELLPTHNCTLPETAGSLRHPKLFLRQSLGHIVSHPASPSLSLSFVSHGGSRTFQQTRVLKKKSRKRTKRTAQNRRGERKEE